MTISSLIEEVQGSAAVMPAQFDHIWHRGTSRTPEVELQLALLVQAMEDLRRPIQRIHREARLWVASEDEEWPFSFLNVCARLALDPGAVRRRLIGDDEESNDCVSQQQH